MLLKNVLTWKLALLLSTISLLAGTTFYHRKLFWRDESIPERCKCVNNPSDDCFLSPKSVLVRNPPSVPWEIPPCIAFQYSAKQSPIFSVIINIWNAQDYIVTHLQFIIDTMTENWELIMVFDGCKDQSLERTLTYLHSLKPPTNLVRILAIKNVNPVFETAANNIGMRGASSHSQFFIIMQDDMKMTQKGWNSLMALPVRLSKNVIASTGRCAHGWLDDSAKSRNLPNRGHCPAALPLNWSDPNHACVFYIRDTGNRGPLLLDAEKTKKLGYLDEFNFLVENDEHDLMMRAFSEFGWVVGYVSIEGFLQATKFSRPPYSRPVEEQEYMDARRQRGKNHQMLFAGKAHDVDVEYPKRFGCPGKDWIFNTFDAQLLSDEVFDTIYKE